MRSVPALAMPRVYEGEDGGRPASSLSAPAAQRQGWRMVNPTLGALFGIVLSAIAFTLPCAAAERVWRLGFLDLSVLPSEARPGNLKPFLEGLRDLGYIERRDFVIEARYANADVAQVQRLAEELVAARV